MDPCRFVVTNGYRALGHHAIVKGLISVLMYNLLRVAVNLPQTNVYTHFLDKAMIKTKCKPKR